ncbi:hypothetical protein [Thioalkalivibrio sp. ALJ8]|uniref:hypothetical protein n=1 Tax=Thioalkalivibrio sp. ALJ8 TaxID=1158757 RepID=UPI00035F4E2D|nr:hypothetical protein [Thioalkalivibrio sp. ALJ8]
MADDPDAAPNAPDADDSGEDLEKLTSGSSSVKSKEVERLSEQLEHERDRRKEDWFVFLLIVIILVNIHVYTNLDGLAAVAITFLQLVLLLVAADRLGVKPVVSWFSHLVDKFARNRD